MKAALLPLALAAAALCASPALAQVEQTPPESVPPTAVPPATLPPDGPIIIPPDTLPDALPDPLLPPDASDLPEPDESVPEAPMPEINGPEVEAPDYSRLSSEEERAARLDALFDRLAAAESPEAGNLVAEEIWALWTDSGSASVNLVLRRGASAQGRGDEALARVMFDHVTGLQPGYAEGWARSARLALEERDFARAAGEAVRALTLEPRHFYALWTLGNVLERLGRPEQALDAYREANALYPELESVSERVDALELRLRGGVL